MSVHGYNNNNHMIDRLNDVVLEFCYAFVGWCCGAFDGRTITLLLVELIYRENVFLCVTSVRVGDTKYQSDSHHCVL